MMDQFDGLEFVDLGMCVVVTVGQQALGITREEFYELAESNPKRREQLLAQWLAESA